MKRGGPPRWNSETQRWETGTPPPAPYTGPMPPRPSFTPSVSGPQDGGAEAPRSAAPPSDAPPADPPPAPAAPRGTYPYPHPSSLAGGLPDPAADPHPTDWYTTGPHPTDRYPTDPYTPDPYLPPEAGSAYAPGGRRRTGLVAGAAVAVIAAVIGAGYLLWGHDDDPAAAHPPARSKASAPSRTATGQSTGAPDSVTPAPTLTDLPDGFRLAHDKKGFTLAVPGTWTRSERKTGVFYTAPDDRGLVQIFEITDPEITPREALRQASQGLSANPGYREISLEPLGFPGPGIDANQLVYAYDSKRLGTRVKVVDCAFTAADGRQFAVLVLGAEEDWPEQEQTQEIALRTFVPHT
ncbi:hypothetical protein ACFWJW_00405 [Streptomyces sp. NPDC127097]|uniref:hypothetical protein n=1 Tax=Streptomyces sp. NPDC127097 TaxID=3347136 RepID=UPI003668104C